MSAGGLTEELVYEGFYAQILEALAATPIGGVTKWEGIDEWDGWKIVTYGAPRLGGLTGILETISLIAPTGAARDLTGMKNWQEVWDKLNDFRDESGMDAFLALRHVDNLHRRVLRAEGAARAARHERDEEIRRLVQGETVLRSEVAQKIGVSNAAVGKIVAARKVV